MVILLAVGFSIQVEEEVVIVAAEVELAVKDDIGIESGAYQRYEISHHGHRHLVLQFSLESISSGVSMSYSFL